MANLTEGKVYKGEIALGRTRRDGVLSIRGPYGKAAELTTKPLIFRGDELWLNVDASGGGAVTVAVTSAVNTTAIRRCCSLNCVSDTKALCSRPGSSFSGRRSRLCTARCGRRSSGVRARAGGWRRWPANPSC